MRWSKRYPILAVAGVLLVALLLTVQGRPLSAQQAQYEVMQWEQRLPAPDPGSAIWDEVPAHVVPLIPQGGVLPNLTEVSIPSLTVQAVHDGQTIAFRLEWPDDTRDAEAGRPDRFGDAAAIQFPVGDAQPNIAMGAAGHPANIWQWNATSQADIDLGYQDLTTLYPNFFKDHYPGVDGAGPFAFPDDFDTPLAREYSMAWAAGNPTFLPSKSTPVENLIALGFGTLTSYSSVEVEGRGVWQDDGWAVVFNRALTVDDDNVTAFSAGGETPVSFAVWNGSNQEVGARKQHSTYMTFALEGDEQGLLASPWFWSALSAALVLLIFAGSYARSRNMLFWKGT
jgi:hypothetical protein